MNKKYRHLQVSDRAGRLLIIDQGPITRRQGRALLCLCDCGNICIFMSISLTYKLVYGAPVSCGCWGAQIRSNAASNARRTHGLRRSPEYLVWSNMKNRTSNPNCKEYPYYGGRGITVCAEWVASFARFYADMGARPTPKHQIERIDNDGIYEPSNCKWATKSEQMLNRRARTAIVNGKTYLVREIAKIAGTSVSTVHRRLKQGFNDERLFNRSRSHKSNFRKRCSVKA